MTQFRITKLEARALIAHCSTDETRAHICSVLFDGSKSVAVATDKWLEHGIPEIADQECVRHIAVRVPSKEVA